MIATFSHLPIPSRRQYLRRTIESALDKSADPDSLRITVVVDGPEGRPQDELPGLCDRVHFSWKAPRFSAKIYRITDAHKRGLEIVGSGADQLGFVCENDVQFSKNWDAKCADMASSLGGAVLSLCSEHDLSCFDASKAGAIRFKDPRRFYGHQAVLWPAATAKLCAQWLEKKLASSGEVLSFPWLIDGATRTFCAERKIDVWATNPSLAKHIGEESAWESVRMLKTRRFEDS